VHPEINPSKVDVLHDDFQQQLFKQFVLLGTCPRFGWELPLKMLNFDLVFPQKIFLS
jgi:hypothetical protein